MEDFTLSRRKLIAGASAAGLALAGAGTLVGRSSYSTALAQDAAATPTPLGDPIPPEFAVATNWAFESLDLVGSRNAQSTNISSSTVGQLGLAWSAEVTSTAAFGALTANPIVAGDLVYVQDASSNVYAYKKDTGDVAWTAPLNDPVPSGGPNGLAAAYGFIFTTAGGTADVVCLKQDTGEEVWRTNIKGPLNEGITTAPAVYDSVVYVSTIPGTPEAFYGGGQRGLIHALDAATGAVLWYFDTTTDNLWGNPRVNSGGGFWHPPTFDENGQMFVGIGNPAPYPGTTEWPSGTSYPGDNLYTDCLLKFDPPTGTLVWYFQMKPHDITDADNQLTPILVDLEDGRKVAITSGKNGYVAAVDRATGGAYWKVPVGVHINDSITAIPDGGATEVSPGTLGGVETPMAYADGFVYAGVYELPSWYAPGGFDPNHPFDFTTATGTIVALNAADGTTAWEVKVPSGPLAGITIANDVLFSAGLDGVILGLSVKDGSELFRYQAPAGINTSPAISGDYIYFPAGGPLIPSSNTTNPPATPTPSVIALKIGGTMQAAGTPEATPSS